MLRNAYFASVVLVFSTPVSAGDEIELPFKNHLQAGLVEQHVYVERESNSGWVYRVTPVDQHRYLESPMYATVEFVPLAPHTHSAVGPHERGKALGFTLGDWLAGTGTAKYRCDDDVATVEASFDKLVPNGIYTMWYAVVPRPPVDPFAVLQIPLGARDGSQAPFESDGTGHAEYKATFTPCLQFSGRQFNTALGIAWHSDNKTYGATPGALSIVSHVQLFSAFPREDQ